MTGPKHKCDICNKVFGKADLLKNHKRDYHVLELQVGESMYSCVSPAFILTPFLFLPLYIGRMVVPRIEQGFLCPVCGIYLKSTRSFDTHLARHGWKMYVPRKRKNLGDRSNSFEGDTEDLSSSSNSQDTNVDKENANMDDSSKDHASKHLPPPPLDFDCTSLPPRKMMKRLSYSDTIFVFM